MPFEFYVILPFYLLILTQVPEVEDKTLNFHFKNVVFFIMGKIKCVYCRL